MPKSSSSLPKLPVSVLILAHRGDQRLVECLTSVSWAAEVLILDTSDGKDVPNSASAFSAKILPKTTPAEAPLSDFSQARQELLAAATHDWVLFLDSDEVVSSELASLIPQLIQDDSTAGYAIRRRDIFYGQVLNWGEVGKVFKLRLAQKKSLRIQRPVHEVLEAEGVVKKISAPILHYSHLTIAEFWQKICRYSAIEASYRYANNQKFSWLTMVVFPPAKLVYNLIFKLGILDGYRGLVYAWLMSCHSLFVRVRLYELEKETT